MLSRNHVNGAGEWLEGISASKDGGSTTWNSGNDGEWKFEIDLKVQANSASFAVWLGTEIHRIIVEVMGKGTQGDEGNGFKVAHDTKWRVFTKARGL